jgi:DNA oxidative demethylase
LIVIRAALAQSVLLRRTYGCTYPGGGNITVCPCRSIEQDDRDMMPDLFADDMRDVEIAPGAIWLVGFARSVDTQLMAALRQVIAQAPLRHMVTPGGRRMSVAMTNCGALGWVSDRAGYRYDARDPETGQPWPPMPAVFADLAARAARRAGFDGYAPDACLINRYTPGSKLSLHQDKDEQDLDAPIVSVSLGLPATFLFGGFHRGDPQRRLPLTHGDVVVWGGPARLRYHGVLPLVASEHPLTGTQRFNLTFRKVI